MPQWPNGSKCTISHYRSCLAFETDFCYCFLCYHRFGVLSDKNDRISQFHLKPCNKGMQPSYTVNCNLALPCNLAAYRHQYNTVTWLHTDQYNTVTWLHTDKPGCIPLSVCSQVTLNDSLLAEKEAESGHKLLFI